MKKLALLILFLSACTTTGASEKEDMPPIPWVEVKDVPEPSPGTVTPLPADAATEEEKAAMLLLGIPFDGYVLSESKLKGAAELRLFTEQLHADATANTSLGHSWTEIM